MYHPSLILTLCAALLLQAGCVSCGIPVADKTVCAAGYVAAVRQVLIRECIASGPVKCPPSSGPDMANDTQGVHDSSSNTGGQGDGISNSEDSAPVPAGEEEPSGATEETGHDADEAGSDEPSPEDESQISEEEPFETATGSTDGEEGAADNPSDPADDTSDARATDGSDGRDTTPQNNENCPATIPSFNSRTTYTLQRGPAGDLWAWYRPNSQASAPSYSPSKQDRKRVDPVYKFYIERVPNTKCQYLIRTAAQERTHAYFLGVENGSRGASNANARWSLGAQSATPIYIIPWGRRYRIAIDRPGGDGQYAMLGVSGQPKGNLGWDTKDTATSWIIEVAK
ncbi:unnamed protein product [Peniophora sp. CBMAI 1063]|nr:unnamed protein product [Peniophora sp. CBMAI 1063]